jgi:hypothetical protein
LRTLTNSLHPDDYQDIREGVTIAKGAVAELQSRGVRIDIPTEHRWWEYGTVIQMMLMQYRDRMSEVTILDVGSGRGAVCPALSLTFDTICTECEPAVGERNDRIRCNQVLRALGRKGISVQDFHTMNLPDMLYDMVSCVSVIEHIDPPIEKQSWLNLVDRVKPGGLFFADVDCVPDQSKKYTFDELRTHNFTCEELHERVDMLREKGMEPIGEPNYEYNGNQVFEFTFFRVGMRKKL